jgi:CHAT domain-containing protein
MRLSPLSLLLLLLCAVPVWADLHKQGDAVEGSASPAQAATVPVMLAGGQFFFAQINGIRVSLQLLDPQGNELTQPARTATLLVSTAGEYKLRVHTLSPVAQRFKITALLWREARPDDAARLEAIRLLTEGYRQAEYATAESRRKALDHYAQARSASRAINDTWLEARCILGQANIHSATGDTVAALGAYTDALTLYRNRGDKPMQAYALNLAALLHAARSEFAQAFDYYNQALAIRRAANDPRGEAETLRNLAIAHASASNYQSAIETFEDVLTRFRTLKDRYQEAVTLVQIGEFYLSLGDHEQAIRYARLSLPLHEANGDKTAQVHTLTNWGQAFAGQNKHREALERYQAALDLSAASGLGWQHVNTQALAAESEEALGRLPQALALYQEALGPMQSHGNRDGASRLLSRLGLVELQRGRLDQAATYLDEALESSQGLENPTAQAMALTALARLAHKRNDPAAARQQVERALALIEGIRARVDNRSLRATFLATRGDWYEFYVSLLMEKRDTRAAFAGVERSRARSLTEMLQERQQQLQLQPLPTERDIDADTALIEYHMGAYGAWIFVLTREGIQAQPLPAQGSIEAEVRALRELLAKPGRATLGRYAQSSARLYRLCVGPVAAQIAGKKHLVIIPDGALHYVPFEALLTRDPSSLAFASLPYLLRERTISYAPSAAAWVTLQRRKPSSTQPRELVAYGDPRGDLPGAAREATQIASLFTPASRTLFAGKQATRQNVITSPLPAHSRRVHFAAHGRMREGPAGATGILLANGSVLNAVDILDLRWNADLVVLSGCETALGPRLRGEGILGLMRAFLYAGAASVAVSLWPVHDESTVDLMSDFYRKLRDGKGNSEALREVKLGLIESGVYAHPYYWAPFVIAGKG